MKEDELMSRLEMLENQLHVYARVSGSESHVVRGWEEKQRAVKASMFHYNL